MGINTVQDLKDASPRDIRARFGVVMERTCQELRGLSCLALEEIAPPRKEIVSSKSFGAMAVSIDELGEAVSTYIARAAENEGREQDAVLHNPMGPAAQGLRRLSKVHGPHAFNLARGTASKPCGVSDGVFSGAQSDDALMGCFIGFSALVLAIGFSQRHALALPVPALVVVIPRHL